MNNDIPKTPKEIALIYLDNAIKDFECGDVAIGLDQAKAALHWLKLIKEAYEGDNQPEAS